MSRILVRLNGSPKSGVALSVTYKTITLVDLELTPTVSCQIFLFRSRSSRKVTRQPRIYTTSYRLKSRYKIVPSVQTVMQQQSIYNPSFSLISNLITSLSVAALNHPEELSLIPSHTIANKPSSTQINITHRIRESLIKCSAVVGLPKVIAAL